MPNSEEDLKNFVKWLKLQSNDGKKAIDAWDSGAIYRTFFTNLLLLEQQQMQRDISKYLLRLI